MTLDPVSLAVTITSGVAVAVIARAIIARWTYRPNIALGIGIAFGLAAMVVAYFLVGSSVNGSLHMQLTNEAWKALDAKDYESAIAHATECIDRFEIDADKLQLDVTGNGGLPETEPEEVTFARGVLNDVATSWFIVGRAHEALSQVDEARDAYAACEKYTFARTYDPDGDFFWEPAAACAHRKNKLQ